MPLLLSVNTVIGYLNYVIIESNHVGFSFMLQLRVAPMSLNTIREVVQQDIQKRACDEQTTTKLIFKTGRGQHKGITDFNHSLGPHKLAYSVINTTMSLDFIGPPNNLS